MNKLQTINTAKAYWIAQLAIGAVSRQYAFAKISHITAAIYRA